MTDVQQIWDSARKARHTRARQMPTIQDALDVMFTARQRLEDIGFRPIHYAPKDGTTFESVSLGSNGIHETVYLGDHAGFFVAEAGDLWPADPILWRPKAPVGGGRRVPHHGSGPDNQ